MGHSFEVDIAVKYGVNAAILLQHIYFWCQKNRANKRNFHDGLYWTYNSRNGFREIFPYLSERQVKTAIDKLVEDGVVVTGQYNESKWDKSLWYALTDKGWSIMRSYPVDMAKMSNRLDGNVKPIPDIEPDNIPDIKADKHGAFTKPTVEEIRNYVTENHYSIDPETFFDYYEARGWMAGKTPMKDWKAAVRLWQRNQKPNASTTPPPPPPPPPPKPAQRSVGAPIPIEQNEEPKKVRRQVTLKGDDNRLVGFLYEDGEIVVIQKQGRFTHADVGPFGMKRINISGYRSIKRWEDAKCDPGTQLSDFFP